MTHDSGRRRIVLRPGLESAAGMEFLQ